jgi:hypothetical protein
MSVMSLFRPAAVLVAAVLVAATAATDAARAATGPTTLAVEGTVSVVVVDHVGDHVHAERLHAVVTDDGARIPIDLPEDAPVDGRFDGELVVRGDVAADLADRDLLPRAGSTIPEDTRAGRAAIAAAEHAAVPLQVDESTLTAAAVTAAAPSVHRAYVARMTDQGSVDGTDATVGAAVDKVLDYWRTESGGAITSFARVDQIESFDSTANIPPDQGCGLMSPEQIWNQAGSLFPLVDFRHPGNHLIVLVGDECGDAGPVGVAEVGSSISAGGRSIATYDPNIFASTGAHELGHNFGLEHANLAGEDDYLDLYSPMGLSIGGTTTFAPPALGTLYRRQLGVLAADEVVSPAATGGPQTFAIAPRSATSGRRSVLVTDPASGTTYSLDLRSRTGRDTGTFYGSGNVLLGLAAPRYGAGVVVERQSSTPLKAYDQTFLVPNSALNQGSFRSGEVFAPSPGLRVTVAAATSTGATVTVELNPAAAVPAPAPAPQRLSTRTPKISGTVKVGRTLKVKVGSWSPRPSYRYQWYANGEKITSKGTKKSFKVTSKQKGKRITVRVTGRKAGYVTVAKTSKKSKKVAKR